MKLTSILFLSVVSLAFVGCAATTTDGEEAGDTEDLAGALRGNVNLVERDNGKSVTVVEGATIVVSLADPTEGFEWIVSSVDRSFGQPKTASSAGATRMTWQTKGFFPLIGKHAVSLEYRKPGTTNKAAKTFTFTVNIKADSAPAVVAIDKSGNGKTFTAKTGQSVVVTLPSASDGGYDWYVTSVDRSFGQPTTDHVSSGPVGGSSNTVLTWKTVNPIDSLVGKHKVELQHKRKWETTSLETFTFTVNITE